MISEEMEGVMPFDTLSSNPTVRFMKLNCKLSLVGYIFHKISQGPHPTITGQS